MCGQINAKNDRGGYFGFVPFYWMTDGGPASRFDSERDSAKNLSFRTQYLKLCRS